MFKLCIPIIGCNNVAVDVITLRITSSINIGYHTVVINNQLDHYLVKPLVTRPAHLSIFYKTIIHKGHAVKLCHHTNFSHPSLFYYVN